jgi:hypothetical protein
VGLGYHVTGGQIGDELTSRQAHEHANPVDHDPLAGTFDYVTQVPDQTADTRPSRMRLRKPVVRRGDRLADARFTNARDCRTPSIRVGGVASMPQMVAPWRAEMAMVSRESARRCLNANTSTRS